MSGGEKKGELDLMDIVDRRVGGNDTMLVSEDDASFNLIRRDSLVKIKFPLGF